MIVRHRQRLLHERLKHPATGKDAVVSFLSLKLRLLMKQDHLLLLIIPFLGLCLSDLLFKPGGIRSVLLVCRDIGFIISCSF